MVVVCNVDDCINNEDGYCIKEKIHIDGLGGCCDTEEEETE